MVSAQQNGQLLSYSVHEGDRLKEGAVVGQIDVTVNSCRAQTEATISALQQKRVRLQQVKVPKRSWRSKYNSTTCSGKERSQNLVKADAAPRNRWTISMRKSINYRNR